MTDSKIGLTVFLIRPDQVPALEKALLTPAVGSIPLRAPLDGTFVPLASFGAEPKWVGAVQSVIQAPITVDLHSKSPAGLMVVKRPGGTFIVTFGHAWMKLEDSWLERDFGRRVALNSIPKDQVIEIKAEQVFAKWHLASERAPRASSVDEFGVEFDRDLVSVVEGIPVLKPALGKSVRGGTSLRLNLPISALASVLDEGAALFASDSYKKDWPDIDNINPVKDALLIEKLEQALDKDFASGQAKTRIVMFTPSQRKDETILADSYVYGRLAGSAATSPYLLIDSWLGYLSKKQMKPSVAEAKSSPLHILDEDGTDIKTCSVFDCFGYEASVGGSVFVLASGTWYEVVDNFVKRINDAIKHISRQNSILPAWNGTDEEGAYNIACGKAGPCLNCDAKTIFYGGGLSQFEFCDLLHLQGKTLYFAKIVSKSSGMSHLIEQVRRTAQLLFAVDDGYRKKVIALFKKHHPTADSEWLKSRPRQGDWNLCMVSLGRPAIKLPFFAKCGLVKLHNDLVEQGHAVSFINV
jgi:uncharacterized protein (TIGR04141 family)